MQTPTEDPVVTPYTPAEQEIIDGLIDCQKELGVSDEKFADQYLKSHSATTWNRLRRADYGAQNRTKVMAEMKTALTSIRRRIARLKRQTMGSRFHELDQFKALFAAVAECLKKKGENRLIFYVAPTGAGKSRFLAELSAREQVVTVRANETWRKSYYFATLGILEEMQIAGQFVTAGAARKAMLGAMKGRVQVLAVDEGNYFGPLSINLMKDILNETEWTLIVCLVPEHFRTMKRYYAEWKQLQRRIHAVYKHEAVVAADVAIFLADAGLNGDTKAASVALAKAANAFGGFDTINRVMQRLAETGTGTHPALDDVTKAIASVNAQQDTCE